MFDIDRVQIRFFYRDICSFLPSIEEEGVIGLIKSAIVIHTVFFPLLTPRVSHCG